jgi:hypothetical protein
MSGDWVEMLKNTKLVDESKGRTSYEKPTLIVFGKIEDITANASEKSKDSKASRGLASM